MSEYIDNNSVHDEDSFALGFTSNDDAPLLEEQLNLSFKQQQITPCLSGMKGFRNSENNQQSAKEKKQLILATTLCFAFMIAELIGGYLAGSLAIMTDAAHLITDCISFIVALLAIWLSQKPPDKKMSFGYKRAEVLGAILSILGIWLLTIFLCYLAVNRIIYNDFDIDSNTMMIVSGIGVCINVIMGFILHGGIHSHSHSHSHSHTHSHSPEPIKSLYVNNDINYEHLNNQQQQSSTTPASLSHGNGTANPGHIRNGLNRGVNDGNTILLKNNNNTKNSNNIVTAKFPGKNDREITINGLITSDSRRMSENDYQLHSTNNLLKSSVTITNPSDTNNNNTKKEFTKKNINIQAAVIHVLGDFIQSIGVFIAAIIIKFHPEAKIADPICTFIFSIVVIFTTIRIMKDSLRIILDAVPPNIDYDQLIKTLNSIPGVSSVHYLNVWNLTMDWNVMSVHLIIDQLSNPDRILYAATELVKNRFDIKHSTIQIEKQTETIDVPCSTELSNSILI